jgi:hypothetical protein
MMAWDPRSYIRSINLSSLGEMARSQKSCPFAFYLLYAYNLPVIFKRKLIRMLGWELYDRSL